MKILFIGDVVGKSGRRALRRFLPELQDQTEADLTVVNAENAAGGFGVTAGVLEEFLEQSEIDVLTSGNHIWDKREALDLIQDEPRLLRPHNYPVGTPGSGWIVATASNGVQVGVLNIMGTVFMHPTLDCPFSSAHQALEKRPSDVKVVLVDFHAEATSEKVAMGWYLDGRVSAVVGTHTHVPTADLRILPGGRAGVASGNGSHQRCGDDGLLQFRDRHGNSGCTEALCGACPRAFRGGQRLCLGLRRDHRRGWDHW